MPLFFLLRSFLRASSVMASGITNVEGSLVSHFDYFVFSCEAQKLIFFLGFLVRSCASRFFLSIDLSRLATEEKI